MKIGKLTVLVFAMAFVAALSACVFSKAARVGDYSYIEGNLRKTYSVSLPLAWDATRQALATLGLKPAIERLDSMAGAITGTLDDGREISVTASKLGSKLTEVAIRIGLGDRELSDSIHAQILANLTQ